jgi:hypothetical protein
MVRGDAEMALKKLQVYPLSQIPRRVGCGLLPALTCGPAALRNVCFRGRSGKHLLVASISGFDPTETLAESNNSALHAGFPP